MNHPYLNAPIRARMYARTPHKVIWVAAVVASMGLLAPPLFFIAAKKGVVSMAVPAVYAVVVYGTALLGSVVADPGNWTGGVLLIALIVAAVHAAILDKDWKPAA